MTEISRLRRLAGILTEDHDPETDAILDQACDCGAFDCPRCHPELFESMDREDDLAEAYREFMGEDVLAEQHLLPEQEGLIGDLRRCGHSDEKIIEILMSAINDSPLRNIDIRDMMDMIRRTYCCDVLNEKIIVHDRATFVSR